MGGNDQLLWLEHSKVWARVPQRDLRSHNGPNKRRKYDHRRKTSPKRNPDNNAGHDMVGGGEAQGISCSICLDEVKTHHKAVITPCMHEYHHTCISKWLTMKQECPLCKSQVQTVLYNIQDDGSFLERELNLPLQHVTNREEIMRRLADILGEGLVDLVRYQVGRREQQHAYSRNTLRNSGTNSNTGYGGIRSAGAGPTPYSMRVQHHANARRNGGTTGTSSTTTTTTPTATAPPSRSHLQNFQGGGEEEEEALIAWRREVYDLELYAIPLGTHHHVPRSLVAPAGRQSRIKEWVHRELHALLETEHTTILRGFVMGLLATYGARPPLPPSRLPPTEILALNTGDAAGREGASAEEEVVPLPGRGGDNPVSQLRPFLGAAAGHFWHELSCFATAPAYTIRTYDSIVRYARPGEQPVRRREERNREEERREPHDSSNYRRRWQRSYSRSRSRSRDSPDRHHRSRRRRHKEEKKEEEYRRGHLGAERPERRRAVEAEQPEDARWNMWKWGDPIYE
ncbi:putative E3 ubiquitin-protein ligase IE61 [Nannochloris sp. 'desiccata']|nr:putative E3 ubiquitin-protein ligase IE61 [Chlorella desiccata (nom. nud.)]